MAQQKRKKSSIVGRFRARLRNKRLSRQKTKTNTMAYGRQRNYKKSFFRNPFRRKQSFRQKPRNNYKKSYSGGFNRRLPLLGFRIPSILIWVAIIGGGIFFGKDYIKPLIDRFTKKS
jgi:hypothetical protein